MLSYTEINNMPTFFFLEQNLLNQALQTIHLLRPVKAKVYNALQCIAIVLFTLLFMSGLQESGVYLHCSYKSTK